ncbi:MAG: PadR family transcriptional regulator [Hungatella sp.]|nr:PadR family transcriptional regulator [Hungatella sp.]
MEAQMKKGLLEFGVLACLSREESYGYQIIRDLSEWIEISESTLYPILRRLEGNKDVETENREYHNRIRRYYRITDKGRERLDEFNRDQWRLHRLLAYIAGKESGIDG